MRALSQEHGVSISTVQQAHHARGTAPGWRRGRSRLLVHTRRAQAELPAMTAPRQRPVMQWGAGAELVRSRPREGLIQLGRGMPDIAEPTMKPLIVALRNAARHGDLRSQVLRQHPGQLQSRSPACCWIPAANRPRSVAGSPPARKSLPRRAARRLPTGDIVAVDSPASTAPCRPLKGSHRAGNPHRSASLASAWRRWRWRWNSGRSAIR
ncbi:hypothetical protein M8494_18450 [Serratia ureilytica]